MASDKDAGNFDASLGCLFASDVDGLATQLALISGIGPRERDVIVDATRESLTSVLHSKLGRLLVLELNAARVTGRLCRETPGERWEEFLQLSSRREYWDELSVHYPTLAGRVGVIVRNRCAASLAFASRWASDRAALADLGEGVQGELQELGFGAGDSHRGGLTVAMLRCEQGRVVYKPRPVAVDAALRGFIRDLAEVHAEPLTIRVPGVVGHSGHGWAEFVAHRHAANSEELRSFYRGIGHWLAVMRLLGGSDLHAENVIAHGGSPVVVDCETLFTPWIPPAVSGLGQAPDHAAALVAGSVINVGLLPGRGIGLGWRGVDNSATGLLPGQQPMVLLPGILKAGSDEAHIGTTFVGAPLSQNHPSPEPVLAEHWPRVLEGFDEMTVTLRRLDEKGELRARLEPFADCRVRVVPRATEVYAEVARMLWHPVSLHKPEPARERACDLLAKMAANVSSAPSDPEAIAAEVEDLIEGDIPFFSTLVRDGQLEGPRGTRWLAPSHLADDAIAHWRAADFELERRVIRASLVSAYINDGWMPDNLSLRPQQPRPGDLDRRRRTQAARIVRELAAHAIRGSDGTVAWIAPVLGQTGWAIQPLGEDLYNGSSGIALLFGAYLREAAAGRADVVEGLDVLFDSTLRTLERVEAKRESQRRRGVKVRPPAPGAYIGLGSQIWTYLVLADWGMDRGEGLARACALAEAIPEAAAADEADDLLSGVAGAIVPLLLLCRRTGDERYKRMASELGDRLRQRAQSRDGQLFWSNSQWPDGIGGFAHGVTGIGWALTRLARETGEERHLQTAQAAFAFDDALFDEGEQNWLDLRKIAGFLSAAAWCHGSVGIGLARTDLDPGLEAAETRLALRRSAAATWRIGLGWNHSVCHGDLGAWELLERAAAAGEGPEGVSSDDLLALVLTSLEQHGPCCGLVRDTLAPGLMPGLGGIAYQLLRAHPDSALPSILVPTGE